MRDQPLEIGRKHWYESRDKKDNWWCVTLVSENGDGTYKVVVHDGTDKVWPVVYRDNIRLARPRTPPLVPDAEWTGSRLVLQASTSHKIIMEETKSGLGLQIRSSKAEHIATEAVRVIPETHRAYMEFKNTEGKVVFSFSMPTPQHAIYPLFRRLFDMNGVKHNLGKEPPDMIEPWHRYKDEKGLIYWHDTVTKMNVWKEPDSEPTDEIFEKQLEMAKTLSLANGVRTKEETFAELAKLETKINKLDLREVRVGDDGHCQFRSVAFFVKKDQDRYKEVRKEVVTYLKRHHEIYSNFVETDFPDYCHKMQETKQWGDHVTLVAAANLYNLKIEVINSGDAQIRSIMPR
eukprot:TRINITY_DN20032_c0_g1_i2.p1 TRINITY_DN20032_c0_g1~~TRINITY_DN20032_c0_g1_i2.p1  ORF type:complete len:347 (+),score=77.67 TRINITY_DN20032_c0_g1_i2:72-1112(+)